MNNAIHLQYANDLLQCPDEQQLIAACDHCLTLFDHKDHELSIRIVDTNEMQQLNNQFNHQNKTTNVLAFPCKMPDDTFSTILGDIILCAPIIAKEASAQHKTLQAHWLHLTLHGLLHLLGYDHKKPAEAERMEQQEIDLLAHWGYPNPYAINTQGAFVENER